MGTADDGPQWLTYAAWIGRFQQAGQVAESHRARRVFLAGLAIGAAATSATGLVTLAVVVWHRQASTAAPAPPAIVGTAVLQQLRSTTVVRGKVIAGRTIEVTAGRGYATAVVTRAPVHAGQQVQPGQVVAEIDGRPVILLRGAIPAYRNLHQGDTGPDVTQVQKALTRLGYADFDPVGVFAAGTSLALADLYRAVGYSAPLYRPAPRPAQPKKKPVPRPATVDLPMSEVAFIPSATARVAASPAPVGAVVTLRPVLRLWAGGVFVRASLNRYQAGLVRAGTAAVIDSSAIGMSLPGVVTRVSTWRRSARATVSGLRPLPTGLLGESVQLTLWSAATSGPVLAVPLAAVVSAGGGAARVIRIEPGGKQVSVPVATGVSAGGLVAVRPLVRGALIPGDTVVIGTGR